MRQRLIPTITALAMLLATTSLAPPALAKAPPPASAANPVAANPVASTAAPSAPLTALAGQVNIPYERFTLKNGLTVLVHTDRKAPIIGVTTYYRVGSKNEPHGRTGFAHLYEHLFFGGSPNAPSFDEPLEAAGGNNNGSTWYDRTNYVETVPKGALDLALFLESDRMGHLLASVNQDKLDKQRGVVENEKRQGDNQPYGLVQYALNDGLLPVGHPYRHSTIGSMADLDAANLTDVRGWFIDHYAPNNVVMVLAGDVDVATAQPLVEKYFGDIASGPAVAPVDAGPVTLAAPLAREMTDAVATTRLYRAWTGPGLNDPQAPALAIAMRVLGGLASSRLDNALVRGSQLAVSVSADVEQHQSLSFITATMDIKPGVDRATAQAAFDAELARFLKDGPTADELARAVTKTLSEEIGALEVVGSFGGKGATLAEGLVYSGDPAQYRKDLAAIAALTPDAVQQAAAHWLSRPVFALSVVPGDRKLNGNLLGGWGDEGQIAPPKPDAKTPVPAIAPGPVRPMPPVAGVGALAFPAIERAKLDNGIPVVLARRTAIPKVQIMIGFDAGTAADTLDTPGTQGFMLAMLKQGTAAHDGTPARDATQVLEEAERLGAEINTTASMDTSAIDLDALTANLPKTLALMADVVRAPAFAAGDVERLRAQRLADLAQTLASPQDLAMRQINPLLFGAGHPYGMPGDGLGDIAGIKGQTPATLAAAHDRWLRPDMARITVVGDVSMAQILPMLNAAFGHWANPAAPAPVKAIDTPAPQPTAHIVLIDRPGSPQSVIVGGHVLPLTGRDKGQEVIDANNDVLGGSFLSRLNSDLREDKGWSYGVQTGVRQPVGARSLLVVAPVQTDRTGDALRAIIADMKAFPTSKPAQSAEVQRATEGVIRSLAGRFETNGQVLGAIATNERLGRADDYYATLPARLRAIDGHAIDTAAGAWFQPDQMIFVVVGDKAKIAEQLKATGLPVEEAPASSRTP